MRLIMKFNSFILHAFTEHDGKKIQDKIPYYDDNGANYYAININDMAQDIEAINKFCFEVYKFYNICPLNKDFSFSQSSWLVETQTQPTLSTSSKAILSNAAKSNKKQLEKSLHLLRST